MTGKLTLPPLPGIMDIVMAMVPGGAALADAKTSWRGQDGAAFLFSRSAWAFAALAGTVRERMGRPPVIWLPDYFCDDATYPLRAIGVTIQHYPIDQHMEPNWLQCASMAQHGRPDMFVLVHYFGRPSDTGKAAEFCHSVGALLIEDAAHVLGPSPGIGDVGDAVFYSLHKLLAVPQGAILVLRDGAGLEASDVEKYCQQMPTDSPVIFGWSFKRLIQCLAPSFMFGAVTGGGPRLFMEDGVAGPPPLTPFCSPMGERFLARAAGAISKVAMIRRKNWHRITQASTQVPGWSPQMQVMDSWVPYRAVMRCDDQATAENIFRYLRQYNCPVESWPDLAAEVTNNPDQHQTAINLRQTILFLPVHQTLDTENYCRVLQAYEAQD
jgi:hypothetical protein